MPATPAPSVPDLRAQFEGVLASMTSEEAQRVSADTMERRLLGQLLALGRALFALFLATRADAPLPLHLRAGGGGPPVLLSQGAGRPGTGGRAALAAADRVLRSGARDGGGGRRGRGVSQGAGRAASAAGAGALDADAAGAGVGGRAGGGGLLRAAGTTGGGGRGCDPGAPGGRQGRVDPAPGDSGRGGGGGLRAAGQGPEARREEGSDADGHLYYRPGGAHPRGGRREPVSRPL